MADDCDTKCQQTSSSQRGPGNRNSGCCVIEVTRLSGKPKHHEEIFLQDPLTKESAPVVGSLVSEGDREYIVNAVKSLGNNEYEVELFSTTPLKMKWNTGFKFIKRRPAHVNSLFKVSETEARVS